MDVRDATEQAYKNGYRKGVEDLFDRLAKEVKGRMPGRFVTILDASRIVKELLNNEKE